MSATPFCGLAPDSEPLDHWQTKQEQWREGHFDVSPETCRYSKAAASERSSTCHGVYEYSGQQCACSSVTMFQRIPMYKEMSHLPHCSGLMYEQRFLRLSLFVLSHHEQLSFPNHTNTKYPANGPPNQAAISVTRVSLPWIPSSPTSNPSPA